MIGSESYGAWDDDSDYPPSMDQSMILEGGEYLKPGRPLLNLI
jgi:hypothetical protein